MYWILFLSSIFVILCDISVGTRISDRHVPKNSGFEITVPDNAFENGDDSTIYVALSAVSNDFVSTKYTGSTLNGGLDLFYSESSKITLYDNYLYVMLKERGIYIFDFTDIESPIYVSKFPFYVMDFALEGNTAYLVNLVDGLCIVDLTSKESPEEVASFEEYKSDRVIVSDGDLFITTYYGNGLYVLDITDEDEPVEVEEYGLGSNSILEVFSDDDYTFVLSKGWLRSYRSHLLFSEQVDPASLINYGSVPSGKKFGNYFYVNSFFDGIDIVNVTDGENIESITIFGEMFTIYFDFVLREEDDTFFTLVDAEYALEVYDLSSKETPVPLAKCHEDFFSLVVGDDKAPASLSLNEDGSLLFITFEGASGFFALNVTNRTDPCHFSFNLFDLEEPMKMVGDAEVDELYYGDGFVDIAVTDDLRYAIACDETYGFYVFDIVDTNDVSLLSVVQTEIDFKSVNRFIFDSEAYVGYVVDLNGFYIFNFTTITSTELLFKAERLDAGYDDIAVLDNKVYLTENGVGVLVYDITNKEEAMNLTTISVVEGITNYILFVAVSSDGPSTYMYCVDFNSVVNKANLHIADVTDVFNPVFLSVLEVNEHLTTRMTFDGDYLYVADGTDGLVIVDVSDKENPVVVSDVNTIEAVDVTVYGDWAFISNYRIDRIHLYVDVVNIRDKAFPTFDIALQTVTPRSVAVKDNVVFVADYWSGLKIFELDLEIVGTQEELEDFCGEMTMTLVGKDVSGEVQQSFVISKDDYCNGRGMCLPGYQCECYENYEGDNCDTWSCDGVDFKLVETVCNGEGNCVGPDECECRSGHVGDTCSTNILYATVMAPVLTVSSIIAFFCVVFCCYALCSMICGVIICLMICVFRMFFMVKKQTKKVRRFSQLRNFEMYLAEQDHDDDSSIAHLKFDKSLFEVNMDEVKTLEVLGEGGSSSIVFKALWRGRQVAFKCFKTRMLCQEQNSFTEFEKEVSFMSSIAHPNIVQFFGACLKPPRVGILMELCPKGEMLEFVLDFKDKYRTEYPIFQKIRLLTEVTSALEYLHSKAIIHRDLKCENVLIGVTDSAKLMDFGVSRVVGKVVGEMGMTKRVGTSFYMAPEIVVAEDYDEKCDVFSLGIMMYILVTEEENPYKKNGAKVQLSNVELKVANDPGFRPVIQEMKDKLDEDFQWMADLVEVCWNHDPKKRNSCKEIREMLTTRGSVDSFRRKDDDVDVDGKEVGELSIAELRRKLLEKDREIRELKERLGEDNDDDDDDDKDEEDEKGVEVVDEEESDEGGDGDTSDSD